MTIEVKLPELGDGIDSADVLEVLVREGDKIEKDQGIVEVETDKATVQVPSSHAGVIARIHVGSGDNISIGQVLVSLDVEGAESSEAPSESQPDQKTSPTKKAKAKQDDEKSEKVAEQETDEETESEPESESESESESKTETKAETKAESKPETKPEVKSPPEKRTAAASQSAGESQSKSAGADSPDKSSPSGGNRSAPSTKKKSEEDESSAGDEGAVIPAGPAVRRFAREVGVDLRRVTGSGPGGRITREDVLGIVRQASQVAQSGGKGGKAVPTETDAWGPVRYERLSKLRRTIAAKMHESWTAVPRVTNFDDADVTDLERIRQSSKDDYATKGIKLTALPFVVKAVAMSLKAHPRINASLDPDNEQIIYKDYVSVGIAVDSDRGLVVPVLRNADKMSIPDIARGLASMADKVRENSYSVEELRGGTFTISNLGAIGGTYSTPIVNVPEVAILLIGRSRKMPVVTKNDEVRVRLMMPLSISYDHRLVDGAAAARFLNDVISYLAAPSRLLLAP